MPSGVYVRKKCGKFVKCQICNKKVYVYPYEFNIRKFCSRKCSGKFRIGERSHAWKGGQYKKKEYIYIFKPQHPRADKHGYVKRAILVMEKYLGRFLKLGELVHHKDKKNDDRIKMLKLFPNHSKHMFFHWKLPTYQKHMSDIHKK